MLRFRYLIFVFALFAASAAWAQKGDAASSSTPYSLFGFGDILKQGNSYNLSMGGTGIADRNEKVINMLNPAAVTARAEKAFMFDIGIENRNTIYDCDNPDPFDPSRTVKSRSASNTFNVHHIVASLPIYRHSAFKLGIQPYSSVNYNFQARETDDELISEVGDINYKRIGEGSLYQAFLGAGVTLWKRLSLGVDGQWYFGNIERYSIAEFNTDDSYRSLTTGWSYVMSGFSAKFGLQYEQPLGKGNTLSVGATYNLGTDIKGYRTRYAFGVSNVSTDTIRFDKGGINGYRIPAHTGVALSFSSKDTWKINVDYTFQDWTGIGFEGSPGVDFYATKSSAIRAGVQFTPNVYDVRYYMRKVTYSAGFYHEKSYVNIGGHQVSATGVTFGMSFPVFRYYNAISFGLDIGQRGTMEDNMIRERYIMFNLSFNMFDIWFLKNLYQ